MPDIPAVALKGAAQMVAAAGVDPAPLFERAGIDRKELEAAGAVPWDWFARFLDQAEEAVGGPAAVADLFEQGYPRGYPRLFRIAGLVAGPEQLVAVIIERFSASLYAFMTIEREDLAPRVVRYTVTLAPECRGSTGFFNGNVGVFRAIPVLLGLPPVQVEGEQITARSGVYTFRFAPSDNTMSRMRMACVRLLEGTLGEIEKAWLEVWQAHKLLDAAHATLAAEVARLEQGIAARKTTEAALEVALTALPGALGFSRVLERAAHAWDLSARQTEVLALVARGLANKEIAARLGCTESAVEAQLSQLLRKSGCSHRAELTARFHGAPP